MNFNIGMTRQLPNMASAILIAVLHVGVVWVMLFPTSGPCCIAIRAAQYSTTTVLILDRDPPQQRATLPALASDELLDETSPAPVVLEELHLPVAIDINDSALPISGLNMLWVSADTPSEEVVKWREAVRQAIEREWVRPSGLGVDSSCRVMLIQNTSGGVIGARIVQCDAEDSVRSSLVAAIFRASPLPPYPQGQPTKDAEIEFQIANSSRGT